jgi:hypothetical protein
MHVTVSRWPQFTLLSTAYHGSFVHGWRISGNTTETPLNDDSGTITCTAVTSVSKLNTVSVGGARHK